MLLRQLNPPSTACTASSSSSSHTTPQGFRQPVHPRSAGLASTSECTGTSNSSSSNSTSTSSIRRFRAHRRGAGWGTAGRASVRCSAQELREASPQQQQQPTPPAPHPMSAGLDEDVVYDGIISEAPPKPSSLQVRVRDMVKHFSSGSGGVFKAVDGVDVDIEPSSIVALLGPSGSGKTTLLRLIAGLESPTAGRILFDDFDATNTPVQDRQIGFVFQNYALFNHKTVAENVRFGLEVRKLKVDHNQRVADLLELVQLEGLGDRFPRQLSGGQRQRVALARSLASNPRLLLLDEPFGALDAVVRKTLRAGLKEIVRSVGVTTIIVTHDQEEAFDLADKVVIFNRGRIEQQGTPNDIIKSPCTPFIMKFVGDTNIVPATAQLLRKCNFSTPKAWAMFRPSDMQLSSIASEHTAPATVAERHNLGWNIKYHLKFDDDVEIIYSVTRDQDEKQYNLQVGQRVFVSLEAKSLMGFEMHEIESSPLTTPAAH